MKLIYSIQVDIDIFQLYHCPDLPFVRWWPSFSVPGDIWRRLMRAREQPMLILSKITTITGTWGDLIRQPASRHRMWSWLAVSAGGGKVQRCLSELKSYPRNYEWMKMDDHRRISVFDKLERYHLFRALRNDRHFPEFSVPWSPDSWQGRAEPDGS